jgi:predicted protein tyrosine phosphatase
MNKDIKILCVCQMGNVRSVGTKARLNKRNYNNVIATGSSSTGEETLAMLCEWADVILVAEPDMIEQLPNGHDKVDSNFFIGEDVYGNPLNRTLQELVKTQLDNIGLK